jgi:hypothetical protein
MLRLRVASLAFAGSLLLTLSGCCSFCEDGRMFPRLFHRTSNSQMMSDGQNCECQRPGWQQGAGMPMGGVPMGGVPMGGMPMGHGPFVPPPPATVAAPTTNPPIPITNINPHAPQLFKVPNAPPTAYVPAN